MNRRKLAAFIDAAMNRYAPTVHNRSHAAFTTPDGVAGADLLADLEADIDVWDPQLIAEAKLRHPSGKRKERPAQ